VAGPAGPSARLGIGPLRSTGVRKGSVTTGVMRTNRPTPALEVQGLPGRESLSLVRRESLCQVVRYPSTCLGPVRQFSRSRLEAHAGR
jgi:hypothetical protein